MAKTESTAVNELIELVQGGKPLASEGEDLMFAPPKPPQPPRMTSTIPPMRGAGEVEPLPRTRAPTGTAQHTLKGQQIRVTTAPPIPPIPSAAAATRTPDISPAARTPDVPSLPPLPTARTSSPAVPPPRPTKPSLPPPSRTAPPATAPVAAPFEQRPPAPPAIPFAQSAPFAAPPAPPAPFPQTAHPAAPAPAAAKPFLPPGAQPVVQPAPVVRPPLDRTGDPVSADSWFEQSRAVELADEELLFGTSTHPKQPAAMTGRWKKVLVPVVVLALAGAGVGGYLMFAGEHAERSAAKAGASPASGLRPQASGAETARAADVANAPKIEAGNAEAATAANAEAANAPAANTETAKTDEAANAPAANTETANTDEAADVTAQVASRDVPAAAPAAAPEARGLKPEASSPAAMAATTPAVAPTTAHAQKLTDVRIDSTPSGATVMLVDNGKASFLGTTPLAASIDGSRAYDLVLTLEGHKTQMARLDPSKAQRMDIDLGDSVPHVTTKTAPVPAVKAPAPAPVAEAPAPRHHHHATKAATPPTSAALAEPSFAETKKAPAAGQGTLMISAKPPCEILIDGKDTGLMTPQRSIMLASGAHKVTLVNASENIKKTVSVSITADQATKLIQDLMKK